VDSSKVPFAESSTAYGRLLMWDGLGICTLAAGWNWWPARDDTSTWPGTGRSAWGRPGLPPGMPCTVHCWPT